MKNLSYNKLQLNNLVRCIKISVCDAQSILLEITYLHISIIKNFYTLTSEYFLANKNMHVSH